MDFSTKGEPYAESGLIDEHNRLKNMGVNIKKNNLFTVI